jgi:hypothetical protein
MTKATVGSVASSLGKPANRRLDEISIVGALGDAREADPWDVLAAIDAVISAAIRRIDVDLGSLLQARLSE